MSKKKKLLVIAFGILAVLGILAIYGGLQVRATAAERDKTLAGDDLIPNPIGAVNHAVTIHRPPRDVWPWLVQMGSGRAGWYSYDSIDNGRHHSAERILPEYQSISVGSVFPALPGVADRSSSRSVSRSAALFFLGDCRMAAIRPLGHSCWSNLDQIRRASSCAVALRPDIVLTAYCSSWFSISAPK